MQLAESSKLVESATSLAKDNAQAASARDDANHLRIQQLETEKISLERRLSSMGEEHREVVSCDHDHGLHSVFGLV